MKWDKEKFTVEKKMKLDERGMGDDSLFTVVQGEVVEDETKDVTKTNT